MKSSSQNLNLDTEPSGCNAISHASTQDCGLYVVADLLTKKRNKLQIVNRGDLRLRLTNIEPDIEKLLSLRGFQV
uniref:Ubiquitin-like protease family profile domain-containing protein n=1 Tax=Trichuris muris TaxID=70415 RepID=A0A5S6QP19_TRIMR